MSGIVGLWHLDERPSDASVLDDMLHGLPHASPGAGNVWSAGAVGLGHRAPPRVRASLPERQPVVHGESGCVIVADARLDNRADLLERLGTRARETSAPGDAQLILAAYERWHAACVERLIGDFAFAIWDARRRELYCARDPMGVRPFYYHHATRLFAFASGLRALLSVCDIPHEVSEEQVANFLEGFAEDARGTLYRAIERLPAGHELTITATGARAPAPYRRPHLAVALELRSANERVEAFRSIFVEAVRCRVRSASPVASTLSGGLDSSSIACTARDLLAHDGHAPMHAVSAVFPGLPSGERRLNDESEFIDSVLETSGFTAHRASADLLTPLGELEAQLAQLACAPLAYNLYMHWALYGLAARAGCGVFLDGIDGDACVGHGFERLSAMADSGEWGGVSREIRALCERASAEGCSRAQLVRRHAGPALERLARNGHWGELMRASRELADGRGRERRTLLLRHGAMTLMPGLLRRAALAARPPRWTSPLHQSFVERVRLRELQEERRASRPHSSDPNGQGLLGSPAYQYVLELNAAAAAAFDLEPRFPFFDERLITFCATVPAAEKLAGGWTRLVQRRAMEGTLPEVVRWRATKQDLSPNFRRGLRGGDRPMLERAALRRDHPLDGILDMPTLRHRLRRFMSDSGSPHDQDDSHLLFRATVMTRWLEAPLPPASTSASARRDSRAVPENRPGFREG